MTKFTYKELTNGFYLVTDKINKQYAHFRLIDASNASPPSCKHMELYIHQEVIGDMLTTKNFNLLLSIYKYVFDTVLEITHDLNGIKLCKIHSNDENVDTIYRDFAKILDKKHYTIKTYRGWIEIEIKVGKQKIMKNDKKTV